MRRDDLMKPDILSEVLLLGSSLVLVLTLLMLIAAAITHTGTP
jgi:hypothetical protein